MSSFTSLADVCECVIAKGNRGFPAAEVWIGSVRAPNPYPRRFTYLACNFMNAETGKTCLKSTEFGKKCGHEDSISSPSWRFQIVLYDCRHLQPHPLSVNLWAAASLFLRCSAMQFSTLSEDEQDNYVRGLVDNNPRMLIYLRVVDGVVSASHLTWCTPSPVPLPMPIRCLATSSMATSSPLGKTPSSQTPKQLAKRQADTVKIAAVVKGLVDLFNDVHVDSDDEKLP